MTTNGLDEETAVQVSDRLEALTLELRSFAAAREWGQFHTPKNLVLALCGEVGELAAEVQWVDDALLQTDQALRARVASEIGDVTSYLLRLCDVLAIDPAKAAADKLEVNEQRYPVAAARGSAEKHTRLGAAR